MLKTESENDIVAYAIMNDISCHQVDYLKKHEGIAAIRYNSKDNHQKFDKILCKIHKKTRPDELLSRVLNDKKSYGLTSIRRTMLTASIG